MVPCSNAFKQLIFPGDYWIPTTIRQSFLPSLKIGMGSHYA